MFFEVELREMGRQCFLAPAKGAWSWELVPSSILSLQYRLESPFEHTCTNPTSFVLFGVF